MSFPEQPPVPGYEPIRLLGINHAVLYLARHSISGALVALKVWHLEFAKHARDLHTLSTRLDHPNIIRVLGMGEFEGSFFCALEYVEHTLADRLGKGPLPDVEVAKLSRAVGSALQYARDQGMVPRSLSPKSILLTEQNVPKLSDFCPSETFGKPPNLPFAALMAPEWVSGADTTSEAGLMFCMGALMYEMLTTRPPFTAGSTIEMVMRVLHEMPELPRSLNPMVGRELEAVCMKCLVKEPKARYASLQDLLDHLEPFESR